MPDHDTPDLDDLRRWMRKSEEISDALVLVARERDELRDDLKKQTLLGLDLEAQVLAERARAEKAEARVKELEERERMRTTAGSADALRAQPAVPSAELARVLAALELDAYGKQNKVGLCADAARLLREIAADYARLDRELWNSGGVWPIAEVERRDAARAKWRLE